MSLPHEMVHVGVAPSGAHEWSCTQCSRRILLRWPPNYEKIVLDRGMQEVPHSGGTGGLSISTEVLPRPGTEDVAWLADHGIDWDDEQSA